MSQGGKTPVAALAVSATLLLSGVAHAQVTPFYQRLNSQAGSSVNAPLWFDYKSITAPKFGMTNTAHGGTMRSQIPWMPGGNQAVTSTMISTPVHPTALGAIGDSHSVASWQGWGYGPYGGFNSFSFSSGREVCPNAGAKPAPPTRRLNYAWLLVIGSSNIRSIGTTAFDGSPFGAGSIAFINTNGLMARASPGDNGYLVQYRVPSDPGWTNYGVLGSVNIIFVSSSAPCGGWFVDSRVGASIMGLRDAGPVAAAQLGVGAYGWCVSDYGAPAGGVGVIFPGSNPLPPGAPRVPLPGM